MTLALSPSFVLSLDLALGIHVAPATEAASPRRARSFVTLWTVSAVRTWRHTAAWTVRGAVGHRDEVAGLEHHQICAAAGGDAVAL